MTIEQTLGLVAILFAMAFVVIIGYFIRIAIKEKGTREEAIEEIFDDNGEITETRAEVIDMACGTKMLGVKNPRTVEWYVVVFRDDLEKIIEVPVNKEMYDGFEIGMHGKLKLVGGGLYSFEV